MQESVFEMWNCMAKIIAEDFAELKLIRTIEYLQIFLWWIKHQLDELELSDEGSESGDSHEEILQIVETLKKLKR